MLHSEPAGVCENTGTLIDLAGLDVEPPYHQPVAPLPPVAYPDLPSSGGHMTFPIPIPALPPPPKPPGCTHDSHGNSPSLVAASGGGKALAALSLLDDELLSLGGVSVLLLTRYYDHPGLGRAFCSCTEIIDDHLKCK